MVFKSVPSLKILCCQLIVQKIEHLTFFLNKSTDLLPNELIFYLLDCLFKTSNLNTTTSEKFILLLSSYIRELDLSAFQYLVSPSILGQIIEKCKFLVEIKFSPKQDITPTHCSTLRKILFFSSNNS